MSSGYIFNKIYIEVIFQVEVRLKLEKLLTERGITRYELAKRTDIKYQIIDNYYKNHVTRYDSYVLARICGALSCDIKDIIEYIP